MTDYLLNKLSNIQWKMRPDTFLKKLDPTFIIYPWIKKVSDEIVSAYFTGGGRIIITAPPRHGKSTLVMKGVPAWWMEINRYFRRYRDDLKIIMTSYEADKANEWSLKFQTLLIENKHLLKSEKRRVPGSNAFRWDEGVEITNAGMGGALTGRGGHLMVLDDPIKNAQEAFSKLIKERQIEWWKSTFYSRAEPEATIIIIMQRWCEDDLVGYLLDTEPEVWKHIRLPAIAEKDDYLGREVGEPLCKDRFDKDALEEVKKRVGSYFWAGQWQQRPAPEGGGEFKREWLQNYFDEIDSEKTFYCVQSWDTAYRETDDAAYSVCVTSLVDIEGNYYIIDIFRERLDYPNLRRNIEIQYNKYSDIIDLVLIEDQASGQSLIPDMRITYPNITVKGIKTNDGGKLFRARRVTPLFESGRVFLKKNSGWIVDYIDELLNFPKGRYADQVDATSQALAFLKQKYDITFGDIYNRADPERRDIRRVSKDRQDNNMEDYFI